MAKQSSILKLEGGSIDGISFYKDKNGNYRARKKSSISRNTIKTDPAFTRTRENNTEFGHAIKSAKLFRDALRNITKNTSDKNVTGRSIQLMAQIKNLDLINKRGERSVATGIANPDAKTLLKNFSFNAQSTLNNVLFANYTVDMSNRQISIPELIINHDIKFPHSATHVTLKGAIAVVDFNAGVSDIVFTPVANHPIDGTKRSISLETPASPNGSGVQLFLLGIEFFQLMNGDQYSLSNGLYNVLSIVAVEEVRA